MVHLLALPVLATPAPMSPVCFTSVIGQRPILDRAVWHSDPLSLDEHLHPGWRHPVGRRTTVLVIAATLSTAVLQRRVDVVGFGGQLVTDQKDGRAEIQLERHRLLSLMGLAALIGASGNATRAILLPTEDLVAHSQGRLRISDNRVWTAPCVDGACVARGFWRFDDLVVGSHVFGLGMRPHDRGP
jgi:hypothetical protein